MIESCDLSEHFVEIGIDGGAAGKELHEGFPKGEILGIGDGTTLGEDFHGLAVHADVDGIFSVAIAEIEGFAANARGSVG